MSTSPRASDRSFRCDDAMSTMNATLFNVMFLTKGRKTNMNHFLNVGPFDHAVAL